MCHWTMGLNSDKTSKVFCINRSTHPQVLATIWRDRCGPKMSENTWMHFPTKYFHPYLKNHPKTPFWGSFNAKPIIQIALRKSQVNGATKLKLYSYGNQKLNIATIYRSPNSSHENNTKMSSLINDICKKQGNTLILGDFNLPHSLTHSLLRLTSWGS